MNYYLKKRIKSGLTRNDMAKELGLDYQRYYAIEKGSIFMPKNLIERFNEIINKKKENEITSLDNEAKANEFWEEMSKKDNTGRWELVNKMHEFNITNYNELVSLLGYRSVGTIYNYLEGRNPVGIEFKKRLYNFFNNETNIQIPKERTKVVNTSYKINNEPRTANLKLDKYYNKTDFKKLMKEHKLTNVQIADAIGVHNSTVSNMTCKKYKPSYRVIQLVKDYLDNIINQEQEKVINESDYISKSKLIEECTKEIQENNAKIEMLQKQIDEINDKIKLTTKFIDLINALE